MCQRIRRGLEVEKAAALRLANPGVVIAVAVEDNALVRLDGFLDEVVQRTLKVRSTLQLVGKLLQLLGNRSVQHRVCAGDGRCRAEHAELEFVAGESKRRCAVAVCRILRELRQCVHADAHQILLLCIVLFILFNRLENLGKVGAEEHRDDCRGRLVGAEAVVVACRGNRDAQQILIFINRFDDGTEEQEKLRVFVGRLAGFQQVCAGVGRNRPVVVLAAAVDAGKRLLVQQADHTVLFGDLLHNLHRQLIVVGGDVGRGENRRHLMLCGRNFVVLGLGENAELPQLLVQLLHKRGNAWLNRAEIVVIQFLPLRCACAEQRPAGVNQILAAVKHVFIHKEVFLLGSHRCLDAGHILVAEKMQHAERLTVDGLH